MQYIKSFCLFIRLNNQDIRLELLKHKHTAAKNHNFDSKMCYKTGRVKFILIKTFLIFIYFLFG